MTSEKPSYGFISYFLNRELQRIPVQFFLSSADRIVWLGGNRFQNGVFAIVTDAMEAKEIGDFNMVISQYEAESVALLNNPRIWQSCISEDFGLLVLFRALHEMRTHSLEPKEAFAAAIRRGFDIGESEVRACQEIQAMFTTPEFIKAPRREISLRAMAAPPEEGIFSWRDDD